MNSPAPSWEMVATYRAVQVTGSLSAAARALHVSQPTVRRQIAALEAQLGMALFTRSATGLTPAPGTEGLADLAAQMEATAKAFARLAVGVQSPDQGCVRISCSEIFATEIMPPILARLRRSDPGLIVELSATDKTEDVVQRAADIAIRLARPRQDALVVQRVGPVKVGLFAVPGLVDASQSYASLQRAAPFVSEDRDRALAHGFSALGLDPPANVVFRSDSQPAQLAALRAGVGMGICQEQLAKGLQRLCPEVTFTMETWVVMHEDLRRFGPVRRVFDHLVDALRERGSVSI